MAEEAPAAPAEAAPPEEAAPPSSQASRSRDPNRPLTFRYWSRPTHLQYRYLYDYRHNYYNDVIDYLDRKNRGLYREIPRPQTWPERVLRSYKYGTAFTETRDKDWELIHNIRASNHYYHYHTRDYLMRRYPALAL